MGFHLKPHYLLFHPTIFNNRKSISPSLSTYNQLIFIIFIINFSLLFNNTLTYEIPQASEQVEQSIQKQQQHQQQQQQQQCEPRILDEVPPDPFYDASEITINAARKLGEYLSTITTSSSKQSLNKNQIRDRANQLAKEALKVDEYLLAVAIAAPNVPIAVVQFRDKIENPDAHNHTFLSTYWRELGIAWNQSDGAQFWGAPFRDCGPLQGRWLWPFSVTVQTHGHKIVASVFIPADNDACNDFLEPIFGRRHSCDRETTFCLMGDQETSVSTSTSTVSPTSLSLIRAKYMCVCNHGYYIPNETFQGFTSDKVESDNGTNSCIPCPNFCLCDKDGKCLASGETEDFSMETLLRATIGAILGACILCCFVLAIIVFRQRKCKTIQTGMWTVLETILLGIILLYSAVALHFLEASSIRCLIEPWFREIGFIICYGAIVLKLYRHLVEFRTRKAHRWVVRDLDLLRYLCSMIVAVLCYLAAFTALCIDYLDYSDLIWKMESNTSNMCRPLKWDYVTQAGEMLILGFGLQLAFASRNAITQFRERQFLVASILLEFIVSSIYYVIRDCYLSEFNPSTLFLALFIRSQLTNTVTLCLIFLPKLWYQHKQGGHEGSHHGGGALSGYAGICIGDPEMGDVTISEMSPEEIRAELKRLYTQLEYLKNKTLRQDNPHISKRRGGRKVAHRRFSLQALSAKHRNNRPQPNHDIEVTEAEPSRTPEDSVCSVEGPTDTATGEVSGVSASK